MGISPEDLAKYRANVDAARRYRRQPASAPTRGEPRLQPGAGLKPPKRPGRSKFARSMPGDRTYDGVTYASKCEMAFAKCLYHERNANPAIWWCRQPVFDLGGVKYTADFIVTRPRAVLLAEVGSQGESLWRECPLVTVYEIKPLLKPPKNPAKLERWKRFKAEMLRTFRRNAAQVRTLWGVDIELVEMP